MKKVLSLFFASVLVLSLSAQVGYLIPYTADVNLSSIGNVYDYLPWESSGSVEESPERKSYEWFNGVYANAAGKQFFTVKDVKDGALLSAGVPTVTALWINVDKVGYSLEDFDAMFNNDFKTAIANYVKAGGNLYLSKQATRLVTSIGRCSWWPHAFANGGYGDGNDTWNMTDNFCANYNRHGHAMMKYIENYSDGWHFPLTSGDGTYRRTDNNSLWDDWGAYGIGEGGCDAYGDGDFKDKNIRIHRFESAQNCQILGGWGHTQGMDCAGFIEFFPNGDFKGTVVAMGLAGYQWGTSNTSVYNVKNLTKGILDYLAQTPNLSWNSETVPESGSIATTHIMTATANEHYTVTYSADHPEIANIGSGDGNIYYNYFGDATFHATATGDGWNVPKSTQTIASAAIPVNGGNQAVKFAYVLPYSLHVMANYDNEEGRRPDFNSAEWFYQQFIDGSVGGQHGCFIRPSDLGSLNSAIKVLWIHNDHVGEASGTYYNDLGGDTFRDNLETFVNAGGNVFVSKQATRLIGDLGRNAYPEYHDGEDGRGYADRGPWRIGNKWNLSGTEIDHSTHAVYTNMGTSTTIMALGRHTDNNDVWFNFAAYGNNDPQRLTQYETDHNCTVLGAWGHDDNEGVNSVIENVGFVEYHPQTTGQGIIIAMGLASYHWAEPTNAIKTLTTNVMSYLSAIPCAEDNVTPMDEKLAEDFFYPDTTTTFRTLHPVCAGFDAAYTLTDPNNIARIHEGQLQFKAAGTVTLHIALTETRDNKAWPKGVYNYDREITFRYANPNAAQDAVNEDFPGNGVTSEGEPAVQMAMRLHPSVRGMDSVSYTITNHYDATEGEAYKKTEDGVTRLYFSKSGKVRLTINLNETDWVEAWPMGAKQFERVIEFNYTQEAGPVFPWPEEFTTGSKPNHVITLPATVEGLPVSYTHSGDATLEGNILTLDDVESGSVTVQASVTETEVKVTWPVGTYHYENTLAFQKVYPRASDNTPMDEKLAEEFFYPDTTTTFRTLHPVCEDLSAAYSIASDPNEIARIYDGKLQFKAAGTVTLHIVLTESRGDQAWDDGDYEYDREITFRYANPNAAQDAINEDFPANAIVNEGGVDMAMRLHPVVRGMDSVSYVITNHYDETQGEALKRTEVEAEHDVTRLYFAKSGKVLLTINLNEPNWVEAWPMGAKQLERVLEFTYTQEEGPTFPWPSEFETGAVGPNSVITLPATVGGLAVTYTVDGDASVSGNVLTLADVESGSVTVHASVTETGIRVEWPVGTYNYDNALSFHAAEVGYLLPAAESIDHMAGWYEGEQPEYNAATWFQETYIATSKGRFVTVNELPTLYAKGITTLWVNIERIDITTEEGMFTAMPEGLKTYIQAGGNVLLTKQATRLAYLMDRIGYAPAFQSSGYVTTNEDNIRSISTLMGTAGCVDERLDMSGHRIYNDMLSYFEGKNMFFVGPDCKKTYNYCSWQDFMRSSDVDTHYDNCKIQRVRDFEQDWHATVFGIQGNIGDYCFSNIVEFNAYGDWQGRILTIGSAAYQWGTSNSGVERDNLKTLTANCLAYLANEDIPEEVYTRDITEGVYGTICWGYDVAAGKIEGAEIYELTSFNEAGDGVILTEVTSMVGGRPYFFLGTSSQLRLTYQGQKKEAEHYHGLVGYIPLTGSDPYHVEANAGKYILYYDKLMLVDSENVYVPVNRAYVDLSEIPAYDAGAPAGPRRRVVHIDRHQTPTGMEEVELPSKQGTYDILGRKVANPQSAGFYIINGQKVVITH